MDACSTPPQWEGLAGCYPNGQSGLGRGHHTLPGYEVIVQMVLRRDWQDRDSLSSQSHMIQPRLTLPELD